MKDWYLICFILADTLKYAWVELIPILVIAQQGVQLHLNTLKPVFEKALLFCQHLCCTVSAKCNWISSNHREETVVEISHRSSLHRENATPGTFEVFLPTLFSSWL